MRRLLVLPSMFVLSVLMLVGIAPAPALGQTLDQIADEIDRAGYYAEKDITPLVADSIERANAENIGFAWLDQEGGTDTQNVAFGLLQRLDEQGSRYRTLIVLDNTGVWVESLDADVSGAADASTAEFARGAVAAGIDTVTNSVSGGTSGDAVSPNSTGSAPAETTTTDSSGGGVPWIAILLLGVIAFFVIRWLGGRRRKKAMLDKLMAEDKAEIREQLKNNADHVIDLGAKIATADDELRRLYEQAAQAFQDVSMGIDDADTPAEIDALDDRIDKAEWQFQVLEARLDGRPAPPEPDWDAPPPPAGRFPSDGPAGAPPAPPVPGSRPDGRQPVPPLGGGSDRPALGADESVFDTRRQPRQPAPSQPAPRRRSSGGGMMGGMLKAGLGSLLLKFLLGGGLGAMTGSRRSQRRYSQSSGGYSSGSRNPGLGGGVLK